ncbi:MAG: gamma-glutamyltransferase [Novosphingobium sp.]|nr:gamma-glutamyltransferase [Novosphingobium sp.]
MIRKILSLVSAPLLLAGCAADPVAPVSTPSAASQTAFERGMVSAADPRAAEAGAAMLRKGGSATDAAIATMLALTVVEPQSSGIGGGGFYVRSDTSGAVETIDGRETAPAGATPDWFLGPDGKPLEFGDAVRSGLSIGVPGNIALAAEAHRRHGKLAWSELFQPAIGLARDGWTVSERFREFLSRRPDTAARDAAGQALFYGDGDQPLPVGTTVRNPALARTLETIAADGADSFYKGATASAMAVKVRADTPRDGGMTAADVAEYKARSREPVCGPYRAYTVCSMGPPSSGATTVLAILGQLQRFDMAALGKDSPEAWHLFAESQRLAYADRERYLADSDFVTVPVKGLVAPAYLASRAALINPARSMASAEPGTPDGVAMAPPDGDEPVENGTSHFAVIDKAGNAVSYTSTVESAFGSGLMFGGFYLNNELTDFSRSPEKDGIPVVNRVEGGKRPRSSMSPTVVFGPDGKLVLAVGAAGGTTIPVQVSRAIIGFIDWQLPIGQALALPVLFAPGDFVIVEQGTWLEEMVPALEALGHAKVMARGLPTKTNAIAVVNGKLVGAADPRSEGKAVSE